MLNGAKVPISISGTPRFDFRDRFRYYEGARQAPALASRRKKGNATPLPARFAVRFSDVENGPE
jgi:hypothetical protein